MSLIDCNLFNFQTGSCTQVDKDFDFEKVLTYTDSDNAAVNITGFVFVMTIKAALGGATLLTLPIVGDNTTTGFYIPSPTTGVLNMLITDTDTALTAAGVYPYEMTVVDTDSKEEIFMQGTIEFIDRGF